MNALRLPARLYIATLTTLVVAIAAITLAQAPPPSGTALLLAGVFVVLTAVAAAFPIHFGYKSKLSLETSVLFASIMLFEPGIALAIALAGSVLGDLLTRRPPSELLFNAAQIGLQTVAGALLIQAAGWQPDSHGFNDITLLTSIALAAAVMSALNVVAVVLIISFQSGLRLHALVREVAHFDPLEQLTQFGLGLLAAIILAGHPWTLPIFVLLAYAVYRSSERHVQLREQTIEAVAALADVVDLRDPYTANHSRRVAVYARELATALGLAAEEIDRIEQAGQVHDIGKLVIDSSVLTKEGLLDQDDWAQLKRHPITGAEILKRFPEFAQATSYVRSHHESIIGTGYPDGLRGDAIPLGARILAVADAFDAMSSARPYRSALPREVVLAEFQAKRGIQWDARVVDALLQLVEAGRLTSPETDAEPRLSSRDGVPIPLSPAITRA